MFDSDIPQLELPGGGGRTEQTEQERPEAWSGEDREDREDREDTCCEVTPSSGRHRLESCNDTALSRNIPITVQTQDSQVKERTRDNEEDVLKSAGDRGACIKIRNIPIEIINVEGEQKGKGQTIPAMSSARQIPIQRINTKNNEDKNASQMPRTPSRESLGSSSNKIKMGTSAIRIPIQVKYRRPIVVQVHSSILLTEYCSDSEILR